MRRRVILPTVALAIGLAVGWIIYPNHCIVVEGGTVNVLLNPSPLDYPSTRPLPSSVVGVLAPGERTRIWYTGYEKDYAYYKVRLPGGTWGYVISGREARVGTCN